MDRASMATDLTKEAGLAYKSTKQLCQLVATLPDETGHAIALKADVRALHQMIILFQQIISRDPRNGPAGANNDLFSNSQFVNLVELVPVLQACHQTCQGFKTSLKLATRKPNGLVQHWKGIASSRALLVSLTLTLIIAMNFLTITGLTIENLEEIHSLESEIEDAISRLARHILDLRTKLNDLVDANTRNSVFYLTLLQYDAAMEHELQNVQIIEQQSAVLRSCYRTCMAALRGTTQATGNMYKYILVFDEAKRLIGDVGDLEEIFTIEDWLPREEFSYDFDPLEPETDDWMNFFDGEGESFDTFTTGIMA
ncbi:hypothetical protein N7493_002256 [Penicillium malachiteum]|uniref:Fungal N-terminal domain-containing protein n=1 Tax=Penicillium malachiteum TaxID=1324776 RepID=A0AAD6HRM7_9EURO|nr:hypothetical protein N7493_002256 [Penicillium malachiteum]